MSFDESDEEIIALYKNGDQEAFKGLISRYASSLYNFTARLTDRNNASDVVQETFIKIWKNLHKFDSSKASFKTWIFTIAKNTATDFLRKKKSLSFSDIEKQIDENDNSFLENIPDKELIPDEALQKLQDSILLNKVLDKLPIHYKAILMLHYQEDMTFDEIGKVLGKPLNTVKSSHRRAIASLRKMID
jgi:RNA polymerase sigma-70 factor, ECF subfamily